MEEGNDGAIAFLNTLLKWNSGKISVLVKNMPMNTNQYIYYSSHHHARCKESVPLCSIEHIPSSPIKMT